LRQREKWVNDVHHSETKQKRRLKKTRKRQKLNVITKKKKTLKGKQYQREQRKGAHLASFQQVWRGGLIGIERGIPDSSAKEGGS